MKLGRLTGEKVNFCTPFKSPRTIIMYLLGLALVLYIIFTELSNLGMQKAWSISLILQDEFDYDFKEVIPLHAANWFWQVEIFEHIRIQ